MGASSSETTDGIVPVRSPHIHLRLWHQNQPPVQPPSKGLHNCLHGSIINHQERFHT